MIDECARQRDPWHGGELIVLADGQAWSFPVLRVRLEPEIVDDVTTLYPDCEDDMAVILLDMLAGVADDDLVSRYAGLYDIASHLLRRNYDLADHEVAELMPFSPRRPGYATSTRDELEANAPMMIAIDAHIGPAFRAVEQARQSCPWLESAGRPDINAN